MTLNSVYNSDDILKEESFILGCLPYAGIKQCLFSPMLSDNRQKVMFQDVAFTQLLADIAGVVFIAQVPDQVFHTL